MDVPSERGAVSPGLIYGGGAVVVLALGIGVLLMRGKGSDQVPVVSPSPSSTDAPETVAAATETPAEDTDKSATGLDDARLSGTWTLTFRVKSSSASAPANGSHSFTYTMDPKCATGSCTISMGGDPVIDLRHRAAKYKGSFATKDTATCSGGALSSRMTVALKIQRAGTVDGEWVATKLAGKAKQTGAAQGGCSAYTVTYSIKGKPTRRSATKGSAWPPVSLTRPAPTTTSSSTGTSGAGDYSGTGGGSTGGNDYNNGGGGSSGSGNDYNNGSNSGGGGGNDYNE